MNRRFITVFIMALMASGLMVAYADDFNVDEIEAALKTRIENGYAVGLTVGLVKDQQSYIISLGQSAKANGFEIDADNIFEIGSISKTFTGILLADMVQKGEVKLIDSVADYLPDNVTMPTRNGQQISLLDLATHRSGLPRLPDNMAPKDINNPYVDYSVQDLYEFLSGYELSRDIGAETEYSNLGMGLLGHVLALKAGMSYEDLIKQNLLMPLAMRDTGIELSGEQLSRFTTGHDVAGEATAHWDLPTFAGAGALRLSANDMMKYMWVNMDVAASALADAVTLSHEINAEFAAPQMSIGLAWLIRDDGDKSYVWHNGGTGGYRSFIGFDKQAKQGVFVLSNSQDNVDRIGWAILENRLDDLIAEKIVKVKDADKYVGDYQLTPDFILSVSQEDGQLYIQATGQSKNAIYMKSENEFYFKVVDAQISFKFDANGAVTGLILHQNGDHPADKI